MIVLAIDIARKAGYVREPHHRAVALAALFREHRPRAIYEADVVGVPLTLAPAEARAGKEATPERWTKGRPAVAPKIAKKDGRVLAPGKPEVPPRLLREARPAVPAVVAEPSAALYGKLLAFIEAQIREDPFEELVVVTEAPLKHHAGVSAAECAFGLAGVVRARCWVEKIRHVEVPPFDLQRWALGKAADTKNDEMLREARARLGYEGEDDNVADALWLFAWAGENLREGT